MTPARSSSAAELPRWLIWWRVTLPSGAVRHYANADLRRATKPTPAFAREAARFQTMHGRITHVRVRRATGAPRRHPGTYAADKNGHPL